MARNTDKPSSHAVTRWTSRNRKNRSSLRRWKSPLIRRCRCFSGCSSHGCRSNSWPSFKPGGTMRCGRGRSSRPVCSRCGAIWWIRLTASRRSRRNVRMRHGMDHTLSRNW
uniref:(northern house mosquito) hypothetical protein n=1 Tax=Culex pipiens TaxID=7175 RepID=A0A8D8JTY4_CULPI